MKIATFTAVAVLSSAGYAFAGAGAPIPEGSQSGESSGRPSAVLDDAACQNVWKMASPNGDTLAGDKTLPYIVNFQMVDTDKDGKIRGRVQDRLRHSTLVCRINGEDLDDNSRIDGTFLQATS